MTSFRRHTYLIATLFFLGGLVVLFPGIFFHNEVFAQGDLLIFHYPLKTVIRELFLHHQSLLWNGYLNEGQPLAANPEMELFYPFTWILFILSVRWALTIALFAHLAIGYAGTMSLLRKLRRSEAAALLGAILWTFGGLTISSATLLPEFYSWAWIPWLAGMGLERRLTAGAVARGAFFGGMLLLVGEPTYILIGAALYTLFFFMARPAIARPRLVLAAGTAILALGIGAAAILPAAQLASRSQRAQGISTTTGKALPVLRLPELAVADAGGSSSGSRSTPLFFSTAYYTPRGDTPYYYGLYSGALLLPLVLAGVLGKRRDRFLIVAALGATLLALGKWGHLWPVLTRLTPPLRSLRYPEKFISAAVFLLVILASAGFDAIRRHRRIARIAIAVCGGVALVLTAVAIHPDLGSLASRLRTRALPATPLPLVEGFLRLTAAKAVCRYLLFAAALAVLAYASAKRRGRIAALVLLILLAAADVLTYSRQFTSTDPVARIAAPPPAMLKILAHRPLPRLVDFLPQFPPKSAGNFQNLFDATWQRCRLEFFQPLQWGVRTALIYNFDITAFRGTVRARNLLVRLSSSNIRAFARILGGRHDCAMLVWSTPVTETEPVTPVAVPDCRPGVDAATSTLVFKGDTDFIRIASSFSGDLARTAFVEGGAAGIPQSPAPAHISNVRSQNARLSFDTAAPGTSLIRVAQTNDGNWQARVDTRPWPVMTVDVSFIGLVLPPGNHHIEIFYRNTLVTVGIAISLLSLAILLGLVLRRGNRRVTAIGYPEAGTGAGSSNK